jgi:heme-degrading monooxygenase HmoA
LFARVAVYDIPGHQANAAVASFGEAIDQIKDMKGLDEVFVLVSPESEQALTMSLWEGQDAMEASRIVASRLRNEAAQAVDGGVRSVVEYEVAIHQRIGPG